MAFFRRKRNIPAGAVARGLDRLARDGALKCIADMKADQHMLGDGFVALHPMRTDTQIRPGELPAMPSFHLYLNPDSTTFVVAVVLAKGIHPPADTAIRTFGDFSQSLDSIAPSPEVVAQVHNAGYTRRLIMIDPSAAIEDALTVEELPPVAPVNCVS